MSHACNDVLCAPERRAASTATVTALRAAPHPLYRCLDNAWERVTPAHPGAGMRYAKTNIETPYTVANPREVDWLTPPASPQVDSVRRSRSVDGVPRAACAALPTTPSCAG